MSIKIGNKSFNGSFNSDNSSDTLNDLVTTMDNGFKEIMIKNFEQMIRNFGQITEVLNNLSVNVDNKFKKLEEQFNNLNNNRLKLNHEISELLKKNKLINHMFPEFKDSDIQISTEFLLQLEDLIRNCYYCEINDVNDIIDVLSQSYDVYGLFESKRIFNRIRNVVNEYKRLNNSADKGCFRNYHTKLEEDKLKEHNLTQENRRIRQDLIELKKEEFIKKKEEIAQKLLNGVKEQKELTQMKIDLAKKKLEFKDFMDNERSRYLHNTIKIKEKELRKMANKMQKIKDNMAKRTEVNEKQRAFQQQLDYIKVAGYRKIDKEVSKLYKYDFKKNDDKKFINQMARAENNKRMREMRQIDIDIKLNLKNEYKKIKNLINDQNLSSREFKKMIKEGKFYTLNSNSYKWNRVYDKDGRSNWEDARSYALGGHGDPQDLN